MSHAEAPWKCLTLFHMLRSILAKPVNSTTSGPRRGGAIRSLWDFPALCQGVRETSGQHSGERVLHKD